MMVCFKKIEDIRETDKAIGVRIKHDDRVKILWFPKSQIENKKGWRDQKMLDVPDWLYDKKIEEAFL